MPTIGAVVRARRPAPARARSATTSSTESRASRAVEPTCSQATPPPSPTIATASESTRISSARTDAAPARSADDRGGPAGRARADGGRLLGDGPRPPARRRAPRIALRVRPVARDQLGPGLRAARRGARGRSRSGSPGERSRCAARCRRDRRRKVCDPFLQTCARLGKRGSVSSRRTRARAARDRRWRWRAFDASGAGARMSDRRLRWGVLSTANIATEEGHPGPPAVAAQRGPRHRVARCRPGRARSRPSWASRGRTGRTRRCSRTPTSTPSTSRCRTTSTREWTIAAARAGKHVLCEKPLALTAARRRAMVDACAEAGVPPDGGVHVPPAPVVGRGPRARRRRGGSDGSRPSTAGSRTSTTTRPTSGTSLDAGGGALYDIGCYSVNLSRMLFGAEPRRVQAAIRRDPASGVDVLTSGVLEFERRDRDLHLLDPDRDRPAGPRLRDRGPDLGRDPVQHPARPPDAHLRDRRAATRRSRPRPRRLTFDTADPYASRPTRSRTRSSTGPAADAARGRGRQPARDRGACSRPAPDGIAASDPRPFRGAVGGPRLPSPPMSGLRRRRS